MPAQTQFTFIDLFAGIGGFRLGLSRHGGECLGFSEIDKDAIATYCQNFSESAAQNFGDIRQIKSLPKHDILTAGVPCQSWSIAGRNLGFDDDRGALWNDTIFLLQHSKPKAFIFENVKGLVDPRNQDALSYILERIRAAGYHAQHYVINSYDHGVAQNRVRVYIIGFREKVYFDRFQLPDSLTTRKNLGETLGIPCEQRPEPQASQVDLFGEALAPRAMSLSSKNGFNDYFLFNDLRNGDSTIHSWDIIETTQRQKDLCYLLLKNRRKRTYGKLDGNPLALKHFQELDATVTQEELDALVALGILSPEKYRFTLHPGASRDDLTDAERALLSLANAGELVIDDLKSDRSLKLAKVSVQKTIQALEQ
jgi:DNA (cytosine-5)-methyltransferase 1